jgi:hypothetical protein
MAGVHTLPEGSVTCAFEPLSLDLRVHGADRKEQYLLVRPLFHEIDDKASSLAIKT